MVLVSDDEMIRAIKLLVELEGVIAEPAGAAALAAALKIKGRLQGRRVVVVVTGGNIDPETLASWLASRE